MEWDFSKTILFWDFQAIRTQSGLQMRFFRFYEYFACGIFLIFYMKLHQHKALELTLMIILGNILILKFLHLKAPERVQNKVLQVLWEIDDRNFSDYLRNFTEA